MTMPDPHSPPPPRPPRERPRRPRFRLWNLFVMAVGYFTLAYSLVRGIIYLLVLAEDWL